MTVSRRLRFEILRRDGHTCRYCGGKAPDVSLTVDHVVPVTLGGSDSPDNLVAACQDCNAGKSSVSPDSPIVSEVSDDNDRWQAALATARHQLERSTVDHLSVDLAMFDGAWATWNYQDGSLVRRPSNWQQSVVAFINAGLTIEMVIELIDLAMAPGIKEPWQYLCGCCWRRVKEVQELAVTIMANITDADEVAADVRLRETRSEEQHLEQEMAIGDIIRLAGES